MLFIDIALDVVSKCYTLLLTSFKIAKHSSCDGFKLLHIVLDMVSKCYVAFDMVLS